MCTWDSRFIVRTKGLDTGFGHALGFDTVPEAVLQQWGLEEGGGVQH